MTEQHLRERIETLKQEKNAVIMAHYYAPASVQAIADEIGDSFYLAKAAKKSDADIIVFCGVSFMGESAKALCPDKKVLMPDLTADCPMAHMVRDGKIAEMREKYDDLAVVCYINSTAELKSQSDVCVTSSNAVQIVRDLPNQNIFFIPDRNLGTYVAQQVSEKNIIINDGCCPVHDAVSADEVLLLKSEHPEARILSHPECGAGIRAISDYLGSTAGIIAYAKNNDADAFIICTEEGVEYRLRRDNPDKRFYFPKTRPCCRDMKLNTMETVLRVLITEENEVMMDEKVRRSALPSLDRMLEYAK